MILFHGHIHFFFSPMNMDHTTKTNRKIIKKERRGETDIIQIIQETGACWAFFLVSFLNELREAAGMYKL